MILEYLLARARLFLKSEEGASAIEYAIVVAMVAVAVIAVVLLGSLYKSLQLNRGGQVIAERLGGRLINLAPQNFEERRLLNVVEEMAIASGTPVPPVYVLDDAGINAFAAGLTPQDAVIGITRGAIDLLSRDELQGVIAHEFSHILNGDMVLNVRLAGLLAGGGVVGAFGQRVAGKRGANRHACADRGGWFPGPADRENRAAAQCRVELAEVQVRAGDGAFAEPGHHQV